MEREIYDRGDGDISRLADRHAPACGSLFAADRGWRTPKADVRYPRLPLLALRQSRGAGRCWAGAGPAEEARIRLAPDAEFLVDGYQGYGRAKCARPIPGYLTWHPAEPDADESARGGRGGGENAPDWLRHAGVWVRLKPGT